MGTEGNRERDVVFRVILFSIVALSACGGGAGSGSISPPPHVPTLSLFVGPSPLTVSASESFFVTVTAFEAGTPTAATITLGTLPAGITTTSTFPLNLPAGPTNIHFTTTSSIAPGSVNISFSGTAGAASANATLALNVLSTPAGQWGFAAPAWYEIQLPQGGSVSIKGQGGSGDPVYEAALSVTGLPPGVTASIDPPVIESPNGSFTVTLTADSAAPLVQNNPWGIVATPSANVPPAALNLLLDVTPAGGGAGWTNQTSYVSTRATPYGAVYDPAHQLIYVTNQVWNRIDVISDKTRSIVKSISIRDPRAIDISIDGSTVWVGTGSQVMYGINTTTYQAKQYILPRFVSSLTGPSGISWEGAQVYSLADGNVLLHIEDCTGCGSDYVAMWNPSTNSLTHASAMGFPVVRSGDGTRVFGLGSGSIYDVRSQTYSKAASLIGDVFYAAANQDGSRVAVVWIDPNTLLQYFNLYDGNFNEIGPLPGDGGLEGPGIFPIENLLSGGFVFSPDGKTLYEETQATAIPLIVSIDVATQQPTALSPAMPVIPPFGLMIPRFFMPAPFAVDGAGMVLGIQVQGIAFDDATVNLDYSALDPASPTFLQHMSVYSGPLSGGTTSSGFGNQFSLTPDVYYGSNKGTATLSQNSLSITSPPAQSAGPVDVKMLFPDGTEVFEPQFFTYGTQIQDALISGGSPAGGAAAQLDAFGLPLDPSQDVVTVGGTTATVTSTVTQYPPFTGEQTDMLLSYTLPPGSPGWTDLKVTTPNGTSTLPKSFYYAQSVNDYSTSDSLSFVLYDRQRNQLYLSAGDHIDVFSLSSNSFVAPLQPPSAGKSKQFEGLALTPDGKYLLAANLSDDSLAAINPDNPSDAFAVPVATGGASVGFTCPTGPLYVAADNLGNAYIVTGGVIGTGCGPGGYEAIVNLTAKSSTLMLAPGCDVFGIGGYVVSAAGGTMIAIAGTSEWGEFQLYLPTQGSCVPAANPAQPDGVAAAADGNVIGLLRAFVDPSGNIVGRFAYPGVYYPGANYHFGASPYQDGALQNPALNDAGSLYFWAYPSYIDIVDVQHGTPALRFGLTETVSNTVSPMAVDSSGQRIFLITNKGLTIIDLGNALLSIGHISPAVASTGNQIQIRGSGFKSGISAILGGKQAGLTFTDSETLILTVPSTNAGPQDLILTNTDGITYTLQNAVTVQ